MTTKLRHSVYGITLFFIVLSGFGQMPVFKRYYIADIPGLGWLAQFYVTHIIHYAAASLLIALAFYVLFDFFFKRVPLGSVSLTGYLKIVSLSGLIITGGLMVIKNFPNVYFPHVAVNVLDLAHLGLCMVLVGLSLFSLVFKKRWLN